VGANVASRQATPGDIQLESSQLKAARGDSWPCLATGRVCTVWRSVRLGGDTKTSRSRRTLGLPQAVVKALREHPARRDEERLAAGELWRDLGLVFTTALGAPLDAANVRRSFRAVCKAAGIEGNWTPRELRTSFVSLRRAGGGDRPAGRPL
jgi:integrase